MEEASTFSNEGDGEEEEMVNAIEEKGDNIISCVYTLKALYIYKFDNGL